MKKKPFNRLTMDIEQAEYGAVWPNSPEGKAFIKERQRIALSKEKEDELRIHKEKWLRISAPFHAIGNFFSNIFA